MVGGKKADGSGIVVAQDDKRAGFFYKVDAFVGIGAIADNIAQADDFIGFLTFDIGQNRFQSLDVRVYIGNDGNSHCVYPFSM
jgi:hypothetical protein